MRLKWLASLLILAAPIAASAQITLTAENPGVQSTEDSNATTETFDGFAPGLYNSLATAVGTINAPAGQVFDIHTADAFGGAGGTGNYFVVGAESGYLTATLTLPGEEEYMGLWLSALDANNEIQLYNNGSLVATYNPNAVLALVSTNPAYYGNPNNGEDTGEPFAYLNFIGNSTTQFNSVVFSNANLSSGLEIDNISIDATAPGTTGTVVSGGTGVPLPPAAYGAAVLIAGVMLSSLARRHLKLAHA